MPSYVRRSDPGHKTEHRRDAFSGFHPAVNFVYFALVICFSAVIQHPLYLLIGAVSSGCYLLLLRGKRAFTAVGAMLPLILLIAAINPLLNTMGKNVLFHVFARPYTLEAFLHGAAVGCIFAVMLLWFGCYGEVLTSDKFICLFGSLLPSVSLLLVMVLRMIPGLGRKAEEIRGARACVGLGIRDGDTPKRKAAAAAAILSALTDWALEGGIITGDSMHARGYGVGKRTSFQRWRFTGRDAAFLCTILLAAAGVLLSGGMDASYTPEVRFDPAGPGLAAYALLGLLPSILHIWEDLLWKRSVSKI